MSNRQYQKNITADGQVVIDPATGSSSSQITVTGNLGGGTVRLGFISRAGSFIPFRDGNNDVIVVADSSLIITHGKQVKFAFSVINTVTPSFTVFRAEV